MGSLYLSCLVTRGMSTYLIDLCSDQILVTDDNISLCHWLCVLCNEARKQDGHRPAASHSFSVLLGCTGELVSSSKAQTATGELVPSSKTE